MDKQQRKPWRQHCHEKASAMLHNANVPRILCEHAFGESHTRAHRMFAGGCIMVIGVCIAKLGGQVIHVPCVEFITDCIGYLVHGAGTVPFVDTLIQRAKAE